MAYAITAPVALVDTDSDGFIDHAFVGDIGGNMWQFKFCTKQDLQNNPNCGTDSWKGSLLLARPSGSSSIPSPYPIYTQATVAEDNDHNIWVFWGTGDKTDPASLTNPAGYMYGIKTCSFNNGNPKPCSRNDLVNISSYCSAASTANGWYLQMPNNHEEVLASPLVYNGVLLFTSFLPAAGSSACSKTGTSYLYGIKITSDSATSCTVGQGGLTGSATSVAIGSGMASTPIVSIGPSGSVNLHISTSGAGGQDGTTQSLGSQVPSLNTSMNKTNLIYWRDNKLKP
jgi:type IV pilus assembly protein PilY1